MARVMPVCFFVAWDAEAAPLIRHWRLRRVPALLQGSVYARDHRWLLRCGLGKEKTAQATAAAWASLGLPTSCLLINVGVVGHGSLAVGTLVIADEVIDAESNTRWKLIVPPRVSLPRSTVVTVTQPEQAYPLAVAYDMEAAGFVAAALALRPPPSIVCLKIVSDNPTHPLKDLTAGTVKALVARQLNAIDAAVDAAMQL